MAAGDQYVKFSTKQARRIAEAVRDYEKSLTKGLPDPARTAEPRRYPNPLFGVRVYIDGGTAGTPTATCSFTYRVTSLAGTPLGTGLIPDRRRIPNTPYTITPDGTIGTAYFNEQGDLALWDANELFQTVDCETP